MLDMGFFFLRLLFKIFLVGKLIVWNLLLMFENCKIDLCYLNCFNRLNKLKFLNILFLEIIFILRGWCMGVIN